MNSASNSDSIQIRQSGRVGNGVLQIETWAFLFGLKMAWEMGSKKLIVKINSLEVYSWVKEINVIKNSLSNVIQECRVSLNKSWVVSIKHVYREGNQVTDQLTKMALKAHHNTLLKWR